ncbi:MULTISPECIES: inovirus Gp2 family protein [Enterobacterales]|uniref:inovirus Gp2 family protein n=1 Tax=Enterobacterales TaxID=91347 RepID=UPI0012474DC8|nr:inovirus Gp2 family protein [Klebsiella aerogenes]EFI1512446.1 inovirus Gp2 family protein [Escherichia coli]HCB1113827.1 inovirus Gp2 family protein [Klebsiella quasipneumoniae subsp. similipneumoniae]EFN9664348.1 inovirus Gp2 family protein [Escherichia coli]EGE2461944.1 inovirus Gp2 family protein [Escherichia coli]EIJ6207443.1 inovirus Gp2 family protein [Escherichia coli]
MKTYKGSHGDHVLEYQIKIIRLLSRLNDRYPRLTAVRVDIHYPKIVDNGDNICCFPNLEPGVISRMRESLKAKLEADRIRKKREGKRIYRCPLFIMWAKEYSESGKCHYHICLLFNKDAYYHLGDYEREDNLRGMITGAWYSALALQRDDCPDLVTFPDNCRYLLDNESPEFEEQYQALLTRLDYLTKVESKVFGEGDRNFGCSQIDL